MRTVYAQSAQKIAHLGFWSTDGEPEYDRDARSKLAAAGLTSDEEMEDEGGASGSDTDGQQAEAGEDATGGERTASKAQKSRKRTDKPSRSRSKSRERSSKGTPRLKKRAREPGQHLLIACHAVQC